MIKEKNINPSGAGQNPSNHSASSGQRLNLRDVAQLIKRSTKSVRNYIKADKLKAAKVDSVNGPEYSFEINDVVTFAKSFLSMDLVIGDMVTKSSAQPHVRTDGDYVESPVESSDKSAGHNENTSDSALTVPFHGRKLDLSQFAQILLSLENDKVKLVEEFGEYKARLAYKVGQLESQVKQLESETQEKEKLKKKISDLERNYRVRDMDARQLLAMKGFYEKKPWWKFWKKFEFEDSERLVSGSN